MIYKLLFFCIVTIFTITNSVISAKTIKKEQRGGFPLLALTIISAIMPFVTLLLNSYF